MSDESTTPAKKPRAAKSGDTASAEPVDAAAATSTAGAPVADPSSATTTGDPVADDHIVEDRVVEDRVVEDRATEEPVVVEERVIEVSENEPVVPTRHPDDVVTSVPRPQVIYVTAPAAPRAKGNRGFGALIALVSALVYAVLLALASALLGLVIEGRITFGFLSQVAFYVPVIAFLIGFVLLVVIVNRAAWWTYIVGSIFVALFVYFGTILFGMISNGLFLSTAAEARELFVSQLGSPFVIVAALLAREVSMWVGAGIAARGRRVKERNLAARAAYDRELAEKRAEHERGPATAV